MLLIVEDKSDVKGMNEEEDSDDVDEQQTISGKAAGTHSIKIRWKVFIIKTIYCGRKKTIKILPLDIT